MPLSIGTPMPPLDGATEWLNGSFDVNAAHGRPTIVQFWAVSCPICKINIPHLRRLLTAFSEEGLQLLSIHSPRLDSDKDIDVVCESIRENSLIGPCAVDNDLVLSERFQTGGVWPSYFLFDNTAHMRSRAAGELGLKIADNSLRRLFPK